jgi:hypothetical protein
MESLGFFIDLTFRPHYGPEVDSGCNINEYQGVLWRVKDASAYGWQPCHLLVPTVQKSWEPQPPGTLRTCSGLYRDSFIFIVVFKIQMKTRGKMDSYDFYLSQKYKMLWLFSSSIQDTWRSSNVKCVMTYYCTFLSCCLLSQFYFSGIFIIS